MSLRVRLTLVYTSILGAALVLFGVMVYALVYDVVIRQLDNKLEAAVLEMRQDVQVNEQGQLSLSTVISLDTSVLLQAWDSQGRLVGPTQPIGLGLNLTTPLSEDGLDASVRTQENVQVGDLRMRVVSIPIYTDGERVGTLQAGTDLAVVDGVQRDLVLALLVLAVVAMSVAFIAGWFSTKGALMPLSVMTEIAMRITRADDLSQRIPMQGAAESEVGKLIQAFNRTLARMEKLFQSQRRFLADVGHELRTPLTAIHGNVDLIRHTGEADEQSLSTIETEVGRLTRLVNDLLLLAQADAGKLPLDYRPVELDTVLLEVFQQACMLAHEQANLRIGEVDQVIVCGDRDRLKQVLLNLVGNAVKYTPSGGEIVIGVGKTLNWARLTVQDNGPGIPAEDLPHIFERFYRAEKSRSRKGFGLGLSIARWIVERHGGMIEVQSVPGKGTTFTVRLPLAEGDCQEQARALSLIEGPPERTD